MKNKETEWDCGDCKYIVIPPNRNALSECDRYCDKYKEDLIFYDWFWWCDKCCEEHKTYKEASKTKRGLRNDKQRIFKQFTKR